MPKTLPVVDISAPICCAPVAAGPMTDEAALEVALRLKALADPARVKMMSFLLPRAAGEEYTATSPTAWACPNRPSVTISASCGRPDWSSPTAAA